MARQGSCAILRDGWHACSRCITVLALATVLTNISSLSSHVENPFTISIYQLIA
jgi:hypothetical protein